MRKPDLSGRAEAWIIPVNKDRKDWNPAWEACISQYLLHCTWSHPFWSYYLISGIHLRHISGVPEAHKNFPGASHEIQIWSLNPRKPINLEAYEKGEDGGYQLLTPPDLIHQVGGLRDEEFKVLIQDVVLAIIDGRASPDQDFREYWRKAIDGLATRLRGGHSGEGYAYV